MQSNGRIDTLHKTNLTSYEFFKENKVNPAHFQSNAVRYLHTDNDLASLYFSQKNIDAIQNGIRYSVFKHTNEKHIISSQSDTELQIIMRSFYLQYAKHGLDNIVQQVKELNAKVLNFTVPQILSELNQYINYSHDITYLPVPLERSKNMSTAGTRVLFTNEL
jgi:hypothetical protein